MSESQQTATPYFLFVREHCHLCQYAKEALRYAEMNNYQCIDVGWSGEWAVMYGDKIPVLHNVETNQALLWPFDAWEIRRFLQQSDHH